MTTARVFVFLFLVKILTNPDRHGAVELVIEVLGEVVADGAGIAESRHAETVGLARQPGARGLVLDATDVVERGGRGLGVDRQHPDAHPDRPGPEAPILKFGHNIGSHAQIRTQCAWARSKPHHKARV